MTHEPQQIQAKDITIKMAMDRLKIALKDDDDYAHTWHCNLAMSIFDSIPSNDLMNEECSHTISNHAARRFIKMVFNINTSNDMLNDKAEK